MNDKQEGWVTTRHAQTWCGKHLSVTVAPSIDPRNKGVFVQIDIPRAEYEFVSMNTHDQESMRKVAMGKLISLRDQINRDLAYMDTDTYEEEPK